MSEREGKLSNPRAYRTRTMHVENLQKLIQYTRNARSNMLNLVGWSE